MGITKDVFRGALQAPFLFPAFDQRSFAHRDLNSNKKASYAEKRLSYSDRLIPITQARRNSRGSFLLAYLYRHTPVTNKKTS